MIGLSLRLVWVQLVIYQWLNHTLFVVLFRFRVISSRGGDTTAPVLPWQEAGDCGWVCGFTAYFLYMSEEDWVRGRGDTQGYRVATGGSRYTGEVQVRRDFGSSEVEAVTGICQEWKGRGRGGGGSESESDGWERGKVFLVCWDGDGWCPVEHVITFGDKSDVGGGGDKSGGNCPPPPEGHQNAGGGGRES